MLRFSAPPTKAYHMNGINVRPGSVVLLKATVSQQTTEGRLLIETPHGRVAVHETMLVRVEDSITRDMIVESTKPGREGNRGVVKCIDGNDVMVRWTSINNPNGTAAVEPIGTLFPSPIDPQ